MVNLLLLVYVNKLFIAEGFSMEENKRCEERVLSNKKLWIVSFCSSIVSVK